MAEAHRLSEDGTVGARGQSSRQKRCSRAICTTSTDGTCGQSPGQAETVIAGSRHGRHRQYRGRSTRQAQMVTTGGPRAGTSSGPVSTAGIGGAHGESMRRTQAVPLGVRHERLRRHPRVRTRCGSGVIQGHLFQAQSSVLEYGPSQAASHAHPRINLPSTQGAVQRKQN